MLSCRTNPHDIWPMGGIGRAGVHFTSAHASLTGGGCDVSRELHRLSDGAIFVDKRPVADLPEFAAWVCADPILSLRPDDIGTGPDREAMAQLAPFLSGSFLTLTAMAIAGSSCLSYEGPAAYVARWAARGARVGVRHGDVMRWNDGTEEPIPACRCWEDVCVNCHRLRYYVDRAPGWITSARKPSGPDDHCPECRGKLGMPPVPRVGVAVDDLLSPTHP